MKNKLPVILIVLILVAGAGIFLYPTVSDIISRVTSTTVIKEYQKEINNRDQASMDAMIQAAEEYNSALPQALSMDPFGTSANEPYREDAQYNELLSVDGIMGYVDIPGIDIYLPVYHGTSETVLQKGVGHLYGSSLPVGGVGSHSVVSAHRGLPSAKLFTDLDQMKEGDVFYFHVLNRILAYQIDQIKVVEPTELQDLDRSPEKDYMTLFTCTPYGINSHRMLLRGVRIPYEVTGIEQLTVNAPPPKTDAALPAWIKASIAAAAGAVLLIGTGAVFVCRRNRRKKRIKDGKKEE